MTTCVAMSLTDHRILASRLDEAHQQMLRTYLQLKAAYSRDAKCATTAWTAISALATLRQELDGILFEERLCLREPVDIHCYYPGPTGGFRP